ncbi:MAG: hypothetical protein ABJ388_05005 [Alphaproteobacteria bacterium]
MTAGTDIFISRRHRRRVTGAVLLVGLWLKVFVIALGLAQTAQAAAGNDVSPEQDLLAALHVICTSGGVKVLGAPTDDGQTSDDAAKSGLLDCARCCCTPNLAVPMVPSTCLAVSITFITAPLTAQMVHPGGLSQTPVNPRAPPLSIFV